MQLVIGEWKFTRIFINQFPPREAAPMWQRHSEGNSEPSPSATSVRNSVGGGKPTRADPCHLGLAALLFQTSFVKQELVWIRLDSL